MKKLLAVILSIFMLFSMGTVAFADGVNGPMQKAVLTVGVNAEFAPFEYYEKGKLTGFDIDLMNYIGERIGFDIEYKEFPFDRLLPAVASGEIDCAISAVTITKERDGVVDYTRPYLTAKVIYEGVESIEEYGIVFPANSVEKAKLIEASGDPYLSKYMLVDNAVLSLKKDETILKLIEKYELNSQINDDESYRITYSSIVTTEDTQSSGRVNDGVLEENTMASVSTPSEWAAKDIDFAYALRIMEGRDYNFKAPITREEFSELIYNLILTINKEISAIHNNAISDTKNPKMLVLNGLGIINGKSETTLAPNDYLTREEAATIIIRMVNKIMPMAATEMWFEYDDIDEISQWASDSIQIISNLGFMNGVGNNKFAPKETYTTEQAIATLVRVYEMAEASGIVVRINEDDNVREMDEYKNFYADVTKNTIEVKDFYIDEAIKLITESGKLAGDRDFISLYTTNEDMTNKMLLLGEINFDNPTDIFYFSAEEDRIIANIKALAGEEAENIDFEKLSKINKRYNLTYLANLVNSSYGTENLAALTILTNSTGYVMPKDFKNDFALFVHYEGEYSALVSFSKYGDGVISANMSFVRNGDKDNIFRRLYEIATVVGEGGINIAKVK